MWAFARLAVVALGVATPLYDNDNERSTGFQRVNFMLAPGSDRGVGPPSDEGVEWAIKTHNLVANQEYTISSIHRAFEITHPDDESFGYAYDYMMVTRVGAVKTGDKILVDRSSLWDVYKVLRGEKTSTLHLERNDGVTFILQFDLGAEAYGGHESCGFLSAKRNCPKFAMSIAMQKETPSGTLELVPMNKECRLLGDLAIPPATEDDARIEWVSETHDLETNKKYTIRSIHRDIAQAHPTDESFGYAYDSIMVDGVGKVKTGDKIRVDGSSLWDVYKVLRGENNSNLHLKRSDGVTFILQFNLGAKAYGGKESCSSFIFSANVICPTFTMQGMELVAGTASEVYQYAG